MFYVIGVYQGIGAGMNYIMYETCTESIIIRSESCVKQMMIQYKVGIENIIVDGGRLKLKKWPHKIMRKNRDGRVIDGCEYVLISQVSNTLFKVVSDENCVENLRDTQLKRLIKEERVANCDFIETADGPIYRSTGVMAVNTEKKFKESIAKKYKEFIAKSSLLGLDLEFDYTIENNDVVLATYTGTSKKVIIPNFITTIRTYAFYESGIEQVIFKDGLKNIGLGAFQGNRISKVEIPATVELICPEAFSENTGLIGSVQLQFNKDTLKINNENALILDRRISKMLGKEY